MKLLEIWLAREALTKLAAMGKNPKMAYRLMKYHKQIQAEIDVIEAQRVKSIYEAAGVPGGEVSLSPGTPEFEAFSSKFNAFLFTESDLPLAGVALEELVDSLAAGSSLSEQDLAQLEVFFQKPEPPANVPNGPS